MITKNHRPRARYVRSNNRPNLLRALRLRPDFDWLEPRWVPSSLSINNASVLENDSGTTDAVFTVFLSAPSAQTVTVDFSTSGNTAAAQSDFQIRTGTLTFFPGDTSKSISVPVIGDTLDEVDETFFVNLSSPVNATIDSSDDGQGVGTIRDDDPKPTPSASINNATVREGGSGTVSAVFTVSLSNASSQTVTIDYSTANSSAASPSDFQAVNGTLTFAPGDTSKTITVLVNGDTLDEDDEHFFVNITNPVGATIADGQGDGTIQDDDPVDVPTLSINNASVLEGSAGTVDAVFTVSLSQASTQTVTVDYSTANSTASAPSDYQSRSGTLTFAPGVTSATIAVPVNGDTLDESDETFLVNLQNPTNATVADGVGSGTIRDDDPASSVTFSINDVTVVEGNSGSTTATFLVSLSAASTSTVSVRFATNDGTAQAPNDYVSQTGTLTFAPGEISKSIITAVVGDTIVEPDEFFTMDLSNPVGATIADSRGVATIRDDETTGPLSVSIDDVTVTEGNTGTTNAVFRVALSASSGQTVTVDFATANGTASAPSDFTAQNGTLTFSGGATVAFIVVPVVGDTTDESTETFRVDLSNATNATLGDASATGSILDDDGSSPPPSTPSLSINDVSVTERDSGTGSAVFTVRLSNASTQNVTVNFTTADGTAHGGEDFVAQTSQLTFAPGELAKTIAVAIQGDTIDEADETFFVNLSGAAGATIADSQGLGTIRDNDGTTVPESTIAIDNINVTEGDSGTSNAVFTVTLSSPLSQTVTVRYATADGTAIAFSDYFPRSGTVLFAPGDTTKTISIPVVGDTAAETSESFFVNLTDPAGASLADSQGSATIIDNDSAATLPRLSINSVRVTEGDNSSSNVVFTVSLSSSAAMPVTVDFATQNGSAQAPTDFTASSGSLTFAPGTTTQTISVAIVGDMARENDEQFFVQLSNAVGATIGAGLGIATITDNDGSTPPGGGGGAGSGCVASTRFGMLLIDGDRNANSIVIVDDGAGNLTVTSDCGIDHVFTGITQLRVRTRNGADDVRYQLMDNLSGVRNVVIDLGSGNDRAQIDAVTQVSAGLSIQVFGRSGSDRLVAAVDAVLADTDLSLLLDGGGGADQIDATVVRRGAGRRVSALVLGSGGNDSLNLNLNDLSSGGATGIARIDGSGGVDTCTSSGAVELRRC
jgi:hypothetical protein